MTERPDDAGATDSTRSGSDRTGVFVAETDAEREDAFGVRRAVFVDEQGVDEALEWDEHDDPDADATQLVAYDDGRAVGAARLRAYDGGTGKIERVAVVEDRRGDGWGRRVMADTEREAAAAGFERAVLYAQTRVREFYASLGYRAVGGEFEEAGIPHVEMRKPL